MNAFAKATYLFYGFYKAKKEITAVLCQRIYTQLVQLFFKIDFQRFV